MALVAFILFTTFRLVIVALVEFKLVIVALKSTKLVLLIFVLVIPVEFRVEALTVFSIEVEVTFRLPVVIFVIFRYKLHDKLASKTIEQSRLK